MHMVIWWEGGGDIMWEREKEREREREGGSDNGENGT